MLVGYYLPGNSPAPPPDHRAGGTTAHEEVQQSQFDPFPPGRCPGGAGNIFCQLKAVWHLLPPERCLGGANHVFLQHINVIPFLVNIFVPSPLRYLLSWSPVISWMADFPAVFFHICNFCICHKILTNTKTGCTWPVSGYLVAFGVYFIFSVWSEKTK